MWVDALYGLLWIITVFAVVFTFVLARRIRRNSGMPTERLFVLTFVLLLGVAAACFFFQSQLNTMSYGGSQVGQMQHHEFVEQVYPPLTVAQNKLVHQISQLYDLQKQILKLRERHQQQAERLQFAYTQWQNDRKELSQIKLNLDRSVRHAWIQYKTQDENTFAFNQQAVDWERMISDRITQLQDSQLKVSNTMLDNVILQKRNLSRLRQGKNANFATQGAVFKSAFSPATIATLLEYYEETTPDLAEKLGRINNLISMATQRRREVRNYALENPDLAPTLDKVMINWLQLENKSIYYRDQLLHAIQSEYLAVILGANKRDNQLGQLRKALRSKTPELSIELQASRESLEKSYKIGPR